MSNFMIENMQLIDVISVIFITCYIVSIVLLGFFLCDQKDLKGNFYNDMSNLDGLKPHEIYKELHEQTKVLQRNRYDKIARRYNFD